MPGAHAFATGNRGGISLSECALAVIAQAAPDAYHESICH